MKNPTILNVVAFALLGMMGVSSAADSKRTANYLLVSPQSHAGKSVTVDVGAVKPVRWKSPIPEIRFFQAVTMDRREDRPGGTILVAVATEDVERFAKKYGLNVEGRNDADSMKGVFMTMGHKRKTWIIDNSGKLADILKEREIELPEDDEANEPHPDKRQRPFRRR